VFSNVGQATSYFSYASGVRAHFVPNFVAMATGVGRGKMRLYIYGLLCMTASGWIGKIDYTYIHTYKDNTTIYTMQ